MPELDRCLFAPRVRDRVCAISELTRCVCAMLVARGCVFAISELTRCGCAMPGVRLCVRDACAGRCVSAMPGLRDSVIAMLGVCDVHLLYSGTFASKRHRYMIS